MSMLAQPVPNFTGGLNTGLHPTHLAANELASLVNYYVKGDSIRPRLPSTRLTSSALTGMRSAYSYKPNSADFQLVIAADGFYALANSTSPAVPSAIPLRYGTTFTGSIYQPFFSQVNGVAYVSDPAGGPLRRLTDTYYEDAGIVAPLAACTVADGGAGGTLVAGAYAVVYRYKNSATGDISDYSPVSNFQTVVANHTLSITGLVASTLPQVDIIEVGVTSVGQTNAFLSYTEIANGTTSLTIDFSTSQALGGFFVNNAGLPPATVYAHCIFDDRLFVTDGDFIYYSAYLQYETFDLTNSRIPALSKDGHKVKVLYPWGSRIVVGKPNYIVYFTPTGTGGYQPTTLSDKYGVRSPHAMRSTENTLLWFDGTRFQRSDSGSTPRDISGIRINEFLDQIPPDQIDALSAEIFPKRDIYVVTIPQTSGTPVVLAYNYKDEAWSQFSYSNAPIYITEGYDADDTRLVFGLMSDGHAWQLFDESATTDDGADITYSWVSKGFSADNPILLTYLQSLSLLTTNTPNTGTLEVYENGKTAATNSCPAYLYSPVGNQWKTFPLHTRTNSSGAQYVQIKHTTTNLPMAARIYGMLLELMQTSDKSRSTYPSEL